MKVRVGRDVLAEAVGWVARGLPARPSVPILSGMVVEAADGQLTLSGFDYESSTQVSVPAEVGDDGRVLVSGRLLAGICRSMPRDTVELSMVGARVQVSSGGSRFMLQTLPLGEYPSLPELPAAGGVVSGEVLARSVTQVVTAAGRDDTLPVFTGVKVEIRGPVITLLATDRYRLAVRSFEWAPADPELEADALVPAKLLAELAKTMAGHDVTLALGSTRTGDGLIGFEGAGRRATSRLIDGEFPKVRKLIPAPAAIASSVTVPVAALVEAVKRVSLVAERTSPVRITFEEGTATLRAGSGEEAEASEPVEITLTGEPIATGFNPAYLLEALGALGTPLARLDFTHPTKPVNLTGLRAPDDESAGASAYIVVPMRVAG
ncbi:DNA polymerase III subunit beta [Kribbella sandramycini]|uniref:Beta sliding clamp n=1 Tax=Kribbella sandramycini TaxID=60450 RepID=A0A7Y4NYW2_9ACTN|nr:DNA polymerase-3 subunit beta [Kribbella sandramycini]NOL39560.1 DNA polymerase III subunit beta [Kribbella sandramycini]